MCKKLLACTLLALGAWLGLGAMAQAEELTISAAASLTDAFKELQGVFAKTHPKVQMRLNFAASNPLLKQIQEGAPVDVFATADQATMDKAAASGNIDPASRRNFARNGLVLIVPKGAKAVPRDVKELLDPAYKRIAVGAPASVPAGRYARQALETAGLYEKLQEKYINGESVRQVLDYVARGEVDAGFVYTTDAFKARAKVDIVLTMSGHTPVEYPVAIISKCRNPGDAKAFVKLLLGAEGQKVLAKYGFQPAGN